MNRTAFLSIPLLGVILGTVNNLVNTDRVSWIGSPGVFPKPDDWPTLSAAEGALAGVRFAWKEALGYPLWIAGALLALALGMAALRRRDRESSRRWAKSWWRLVLGAMFLAAAWPKFADPEGFAMMVAQYQMLPAFSVNAFSVWLPAVELAVGVSLLFSPWERESSAWIALLMLMFIVALSQALARNLGIACGCFDIKGATDAAETWFALLRDLVLLIPIAWLWRRAEHRWLWRF
jgi:hypothetical protein